ncbi:phospholipase effector Tle1 domain-containing protein [Mycolicibacterium pyrenivorans]|uniref:phospholipase effector Tle1 domain-containing protein n=1 Tax=Mycolicibacterium pyrenivorans TaxID=187102 RepID=UPI0021F2966E|nr:DUF2235 domain-containing protein [Mycolicibacterium pyrenivorans]MCV7152516.1 DUF2235 domain-containing protein [Mycolicibacterium pyrenivorans]
MKNIALCFDHVGNRTTSTGSTNVAALAALLPTGDEQVVWSSADLTVEGVNRFATRHRRSAAVDVARASVSHAYEFLVDRWEPGDRLYLFGAGRGAFCARALTRVLGTVGVLRGPDVAGWTAADFREYVLGTYAMPRTHRSTSDWQRVTRLAAQLCGRGDLTVDVEFLGLWDTIAVPGLPRADTPDPLSNVIAARHAVAIDGGVGPYGVQPLPPSADGIEEVWFRGAHCDVAGGQHACTPLSDIALDWVLDGAVRAGAVVDRDRAPAPAAVDALAGSAHPVSFRKLPTDAVVHASVQSYLRAHPSYWRRLPARVVWADAEWGARSERLLSAPSAPAVAPALAVAS